MIPMRLSVALVLSGILATITILNIKRSSVSAHVVRQLKYATSLDPQPLTVPGLNLDHFIGLPAVEAAVRDGGILIIGLVGSDTNMLESARRLVRGLTKERPLEPALRHAYLLPFDAAAFDQLILVNPVLPRDVQVHTGNIVRDPVEFGVRTGIRGLPFLMLVGHEGMVEQLLIGTPEQGDIDLTIACANGAEESICRRSRVVVRPYTPFESILQE